MIQHISPLVDLAALDRCRLTGVLLHRCCQRLAAIQNVQPRRDEIEAAFHQVAQQLAHHRRVLRGSLPYAQDRFAPVFTDAQRGHHLLPFERRRVDQQRAQPHLVQPSLHHVLQLRPARLDEVFTDCALLQPVCFGELAHRLAVLPCAQPEHQLLPHGLGQRLAAVEHFVAAQPHFLVLGGPHAWPLDRNLLAHHHAVAALTTPPAGRPVRLPLAARAGQCPDFFLHQQIHQLQAGLTNQFTHAFTQPAHHLGHGQHHLHRRISIRGHCLELLHSSLRLNLVWFLHSDSPFSRQKKLLSAYQRLRAGESLLSTIYRAFSRDPSRTTENEHLRAENPVRAVNTTAFLERYWYCILLEQARRDHSPDLRGRPTYFTRMRRRATWSAPMD